MTSIREVMGVGSYTTSGRGMTSYCLSDGRVYSTQQQYDTVISNFTKKFGPPLKTDDRGARYWFHEMYGVIILPIFHPNRFNYVEVDKYGTLENLYNQIG